MMTIFCMHMCALCTSLHVVYHGTNCSAVGLGKHSKHKECLRANLKIRIQTIGTYLPYMGMLYLYATCHQVNQHRRGSPREERVG